MDSIVLILRFRDLRDPSPGHTIAEHEKIIAQPGGYAWWGWWKKQSEQVPEQLWSDLRRQTEHAPAQAYLLDSGQRKLYRVDLLDVYFDPGRLHVPPPEGGTKTPSYYAKGVSDDGKDTTPFASWFKIAGIEEVSPELVRELAYAEVPRDDLVQATPEQTVNRRIDSIADLLLYGNVTYWVAKRAAKDAPVASRPYIQIPPAIAPKTIVMSENHRVLHISDLHVASGRHAFSLDAGDENNLTLAAALLHALGPDDLPGIVLVTGDLTWTGTESEFIAAFNCLDALRSVFGLTRQHFVIVPGNHDLGWTREEAPKSADRDDKSFTPKYRMANTDAKAAYQAFFQRWYQTDPDKYLSVGRRYFVSGAGTLDVVGLNSSALQQVEGSFSGLGRVPEPVFKDAVEQMNWNAPVRATTFRFVLTHHHVLPVVPVERAEDAARGFGMALDASSQLARNAENQVDLVLHGHQHHPFAAYFSALDLMNTAKPVRGVHVLGGGSVSVAAEHLGPIRQNTFNLLELHQSGAIRSHLYITSAGTTFNRISSIEARASGWCRL